MQLWLKEEYFLYEKEASEMKEKETLLNKKEIKKKCEILRDELIWKCCIRLKEEIEKWNIWSIPDREEYSFLEREKVKDKYKKL